MANKGKGYSKNPKDWVQVEFVNVEMSADDKKKFKALKEAELNDLYQVTTRMIENGYKASTTWDDDHNCFIFSLTCKRETDPNFNLCMVSRSDNRLEAEALAAYKTRYMCSDGDWNQFKRDMSFG